MNRLVAGAQRWHGESMHDFRFGVSFSGLDPRMGWRDKCRRAEQLGYDVIQIPDHLGTAAPFPTLVAAADATERVRVGTMVLNAGFWNPRLLAREIGSTDALTGGRLELGLGAGHMKWEFDAAGIPWEEDAARVDRLERLTRDVTDLLTSDDHEPHPAQRPRPPVLIGGHGKKVLRLAARYADIVGFGGVRQKPGEAPGTLEAAPAEETAERVELVRAHLGGRDAEFNVLVQKVIVTGDRQAAAADLAERLMPDLTPGQVLDLPVVLIGTPGEIADQMRERRKRYGFSYITVFEWDIEDFAEVIRLLREQERPR